MKKWSIMVLVLLVANLAIAQEQTETVGMEQTDEVLQRGEKQGELVLAVGGQRITLGSVARSRTSVSSMVEVSRNHVAFGLSAVEFGFSLLSWVDYAGFSPSEHGFMDQKVGKSIHIGWRVFDLDIALNRTRSLSLVTGLSVGWDNYRFDPAWTLANVENQIVPIALEEKKKSKLTTCQLGLPIGLKYRPMRKVELTLFAYGELLTDVYTKVSSPKEKADLHGVNDFRVGVQATATYGNIGLYFKHSLTPMFKSGVGPRCYPISVGLAWGF